MRNLSNVLLVIFLMMITLGTTIAQTQKKYATRFLENSNVSRGSHFSFRSTKSDVNIHKYFGTSELAIDQWIGEAEEFVEDELGINLPNSLFNKFEGLTVPLPNRQSFQINGWEQVNEFQLMTPYIGGRMIWSGRGRMEEPALFLQPANLWRLGKELVSDRPDEFVVSATELALLEAANEQTLLRGRASFELTCDLKNMIWFRLKKPVTYIGKSRWWIKPELQVSRVWSFDASHRLGLASLVDARQHLDDAVDGGIFESQSDTAVDFLAAKVDNILFAPIGVPLYKGYKSNVGIAVGNSWMRVSGGVSYERIYNSTPGASALKSIQYSIGLNVGLQGY